jgi:sulfite reductase (NADPH) flavoprotein alpha-component
LADTLLPLAPRSYSVASITADGCVQLLVRQARRRQRAGCGVGLADHLGARSDAAIELRLLPNPGFALVDDEVPCIFIGNGSGFAGLRAHLRERVRRGHGRNWLVYGERNAAHDAFCAEDIAHWQAAGRWSASTWCSPATRRNAATCRTGCARLPTRCGNGWPTVP